MVLSNVAVCEKVVRLEWLGSGWCVNLSNLVVLAERCNCLQAVAKGLKLEGILRPDVRLLVPFIMALMAPLVALMVAALRESTLLATCLIPCHASSNTLPATAGP